MYEKLWTPFKSKWEIAALLLILMLAAWKAVEIVMWLVKHIEIWVK